MIPNGVKRMNRGDIWLAVDWEVCAIAENTVPVLYPENNPKSMPIPGINIIIEIARLFANIPI
jgi:hypothetical protein